MRQCLPSIEGLISFILLVFILITYDYKKGFTPWIRNLKYFGVKRLNATSQICFWSQTEKETNIQCFSEVSTTPYMALVEVTRARRKFKKFRVRFRKYSSIQNGKTASRIEPIFVLKLISDIYRSQRITPQPLCSCQIKKEKLDKRLETHFSPLFHTTRKIL